MLKRYDEPLILSVCQMPANLQLTREQIAAQMQQGVLEPMLEVPETEPMLLSLLGDDGTVTQDEFTDAEAMVTALEQQYAQKLNAPHQMLCNYTDESSQGRAEIWCWWLMSPDRVNLDCRELARTR